MLFEELVQRLREDFPDRRFLVDLKPHAKVIFEEAHPDVGPVEILDDGSELIVNAGRFTHGHFSCFDESLTQEQKNVDVIDGVVEFLKAMFADQIVMWGSHKGGGGWYRRGHDMEAEAGVVIPSGPRFVWSGPLRKGA